MVDTGQAAIDNATPRPVVSNPHFSDEWLAQQEAAYQQQQAASARQGLTPDGYPLDETPNADRTSAFEAGVLGFADALTFGFGDEIDAGLGAFIPGDGRKTVWDGNGFSAAYDANVRYNRDLLAAAQDEHPWAYGAGAVGGSLVPITGAAGGAAKAAGALGKLKSAAKTGAVYGAAYGAGSDEGNPLERLDGAAYGAATGAVGGVALHGAAKAGNAALSPVARKLLPKLADAQFAREQAANPHVLTDAQVADDLDRIVQTMMVDGAKRKLSKGQHSTLLNRVSDLEASYLPADEISTLDLPPSLKASLKSAMARRHLLSDAEVQSLRDGTPAGEAVADGIEKARRLRAYVSETSGSSNGVTKALAEALGSTAGWKAGGPLGGAIGGRLGRAAVSRSEGRAAQDAIDLAANAKRFAQLPDVATAMEAKGPTDTGGLSRAMAEALDAPYLAKAKADRLEAEGRKVAIRNARDNVTPSGGWRGLIYERTGLRPAEQDAGALAALKDGAISPAQFEAYLSDPSKLTAGNAGNALIDRLGSYAESGRFPRDPKWKPRPLLPREAELLKELDTVDPERMTLSDGVPIRDSEIPEGYVGEWITPANRKRSEEIRAELERLRSPSSQVRNPLAYTATANANQQRVTDALSAVRSREGLADTDRETIATALAAIGNTSSREEAQAIATDALDRLGPEQRDYARSLLSPLVAQIRHQRPLRPIRR
ncbi:hypothetical protein [Erythrobacter sp. SG61-1L]|uniref:hypothetical protein n=1 Tax=Erythrobacter sp. SG61-1L TaxID=1603897 RepID=UPI0012E1F8D8|nr:hypothetical protein [Erythrobacter sp. SG61-1L]